MASVKLPEILTRQLARKAQGSMPRWRPNVPLGDDTEAAGHSPGRGTFRWYGCMGAGPGAQNINLQPMRLVTTPALLACTAMHRHKWARYVITIGEFIRALPLLRGVEVLPNPVHQV